MRPLRRLRMLPDALRIVFALLGGLAPAAAGSNAPDAPNVVPLVMRTPHHGFNRMLIQVTVCVPGTTTCATIDDVMIDTGAAGLRLDAAALPSWLRLPAFVGPDGTPLAECLHFVHDVAWGTLHRADIQLGALTAADLPIQIVGDSRKRPPSCPDSDAPPTSNGTLGLGPELSDCPGACRQSADRPLVFACAGDACTPLPGDIAPPFRLPNPVSRLPVHNNGIVVELAAAPAGGAEALAGTLTFGVGTAANNRLGAALRVPLDRAGRFTTLYRGRAYPESYIDSGTPANIFADPDLQHCPTMDWAFCVAPERTLSAEIVGQDGARLPVPFPVGSYEAFSTANFGASASVAFAAEAQSKAFVWGAPFFAGKRVFVVMDGKAVPGVPGATGPFYAFEALAAPH